MSAEIELKLAVAPEVVAALLTSDELQRWNIALAPPQRQVTTYYDTAKRALLKKQVFLRIRQKGETITQTVKTAGPASLLAERGEWEWDLDQPVPDLDRAAETDLKPILKRQKKGGLVPLFASEIERRAALVASGDTQLEIVLDQGLIRAGRRTAKVSEIEVEVKAGETGPLFALARDLVSHRGVRVAFATKAERGFALADGKAAAAVKAPENPLSAGMTPLEAAAAILDGCAVQAAGNLPLIVDKRLPEAIHQLRVSMRRLKAALALFKEQIPKKRRKHLKEECSWLAGIVGPARDLDVMTMSTLKDATAPDGLAADLDALKKAVVASRRAAWQQAMEAAASPRASLLLLDLAETAKELRSEMPDPLAPPLALFAHDALDARLAEVMELGQRIDELSTEERHEMRLALKKLRYAADFFEDLFPHKAVKHGLKALAKLQDAFGGFNDAAVAGAVLERVAAAASPKSRPKIERAMLYVTGWAGYRGSEDWATARACWDDFSAERPFWR